MIGIRPLTIVHRVRIDEIGPSKIVIPVLGM